ncbi:hypothetical protein C7U79_29390, partial [Escherichia coli]
GYTTRELSGQPRRRTAKDKPPAPLTQHNSARRNSRGEDTSPRRENAPAQTIRITRCGGEGEGDHRERNKGERRHRQRGRRDRDTRQRKGGRGGDNRREVEVTEGEKGEAKSKGGGSGKTGAGGERGQGGNASRDGEGKARVEEDERGYT